MPDARPSTPPTAAELDERLRGADLDALLSTVAEIYGQDRLAVVSAFGPGSLVVLHRLSDLGIRLPVIFIDTLHHFPETLEHVERVRAKYDLDLRIHRHLDTREEFERRYGKRLWERDLDRYQELSKVEPFVRATTDLDAWITGRRRGQTQLRTALPVVEGDDQLKINPLAAWDRSRVWKFILDNEIPYNPLHDQGYASIGDEPLTTSVREGESERAGRWRGLDREECGIHLV